MRIKTNKFHPNWRYQGYRYVNDYPAHLRGLAQNKWGGHRSGYMRTYGGKFGAASECRSLPRDDIKKLEAEMRAAGKLD